MKKKVFYPGDIVQNSMLKGNTIFFEVMKQKDDTTTVKHSITEDIAHVYLYPTNDLVHVGNKRHIDSNSKGES